MLGLLQDTHRHTDVAWPTTHAYYSRSFVPYGVAQLVEALCYKPAGRWIDSRVCHWNFSLTQSFRPHCVPGVDSASNRNEYQEYFLGGKGGRCVFLTILPPSYAAYLECLGAPNSCIPQGLSRPVMGWRASSASFSRLRKEDKTKYFYVGSV
jgi:hypothetical protein